MSFIINTALFLAFAFLLWLYLISPADSPEEAEERFLHRPYAHRGFYDLSSGIPENSLAAFDKAARRGYGIELDITLSKDEKVVVFHDDNLKRACKTDADIHDLTFTELSSLRLFGTDERIPLFSDVLNLIDGRVPLIVEFKNMKDHSKLIKRAFELLENYSGAFCVESFNPFIVGKIRRLHPAVFRGQLSGGMLRKKFHPLLFLGEYLLLNFISRPHFIAYEHSAMKNPSYRAAVRLLHANPVAWTVKNPDVYGELAGKGVDTQIFEGFTPEV